MDQEFTGPFPRYSGAISAITGGSPEDINEMPASLNTKEGYTNDDGSDLKSANRKVTPKEIAPKNKSGASNNGSVVSIRGSVVDIEFKKRLPPSMHCYVLEIRERSLSRY